MSKNQWTVTGLLVFLLFLEVLRSPTVRTWFSDIWKSFSGMMSNGQQKQGQ